MSIRLETHHIILRKLRADDLEDVYEYMKDPETMRFFVDGPYDKNQIIDMLNPEGEQEHFAMVLKSNMKTIGHIDLHQWFAKDTYEIGWAINKKYARKGLATESAKRVLEYAFRELKAHRVIATCQPENIASNKICQKLGMRLEGTFIKCIYSSKDNSWWDENFYAILSEEFD